MLNSTVYVAHEATAVLMVKTVDWSRVLIVVCFRNADVTKKEADNKSQQRKRRHASSSANDIVNETSDVENQAHIELSEWTHSKKKKKKQK